MIPDIEIPDEILEIITIVRGKLKEIGKSEDRELLDYYISDRRWKKIVHLLQTSAFLNGRNCINHSDLCLLCHTLWNKVECIPSVLKIVSSSLFADLDKRLENIKKELDSNIKSILPTEVVDELSCLKTYNYFYFKLKDYPKNNCYIFISDYKHLDVSCYTDGVIYWDERQKAYQIRILDLTRPFATSNITTSKIEKIKVKRIIGGLEADGCNYKLEVNSAPNNTFQNDFLPFDGNKHLEDELYKNIKSFKNDLNERLENMSKSQNLFISSDDVKWMKKEALSLGKQIEQIEIKATGLFKPIKNECE